MAKVKQQGTMPDQERARFPADMKSQGLKAGGGQGLKQDTASRNYGANLGKYLHKPRSK